jgi:hypothetical protein
MSTLLVNNLNTATGTTITIPTGKQLIGTDISSIVAPGMIIQTVTNIFDTQVSKASTSMGTTGHSLTITPKFSNSKILIHNSGTAYNEGNNVHQYRTVYRGSTDLAPSTEGFVLCSAGTSNTGRWNSIYFEHFDSPNTTSATTYTIHYRGNSGNESVFYSYGTNYPQILTLHEIAQ